MLQFFEQFGESVFQHVVQKELEDEAAAHAAADAEGVAAAVAAAELAAGEAIRLRLGTVVEGVGSALHCLEGGEGGGGEAAGSCGKGHRVVDRNDSFVAFVPFAAPSPFSIYIVPLRPTGHFLDSTEAEREDLAEVMWRALRRLHVLLREPDYNMVLRSAPLAGRHRQRAVNANAYYRYHVSITPRLGAGAMAGFEMGSGIFSNGNLPEDDAQALREVDVTA